jgi:hypothetical protein
MNVYAHTADLTHNVHDALVRWARRLLKEADLETVEVYGQFPPEGTTASHLVLFPYWVGPLPKMVEQGRQVSLMNPTKHGDGKVSFVPLGWWELGETLSHVASDWFPNVRPMVGNKDHPIPMPKLTDLPKPMQKWYKAAAKDAGEGEYWIAKWNGVDHAPPPALGWRPGLHLVVRYIAVASDPGRGTSQYSSTGAPLALPALAVLATSVHIERRVKLMAKPPPIPELLDSFIEATIKSVEGPNKEKLEQLANLLRTPEEIGIAISPVDDLSNQEFALLMQALQRPLQACLNFQVRMVLGSTPVFEPGVVTRTRAPQPKQGFFLDDGSG